MGHHGYQGFDHLGAQSGTVTHPNAKLDEFEYEAVKKVVASIDNKFATDEAKHHAKLSHIVRVEFHRQASEKQNNAERCCESVVVHANHQYGQHQEAVGCENTS